MRRRRTSRWSRLAGSTIGTAVITAGLVLLGPTGPAVADHQQPEPGRRIVEHTVRPGDTPSGLAVRYHAWTAELIAHNHLASRALQVGDRIEVPVVISAARQAGSQRDKKASVTKKKRAGETKQAGKKKRAGKRKWVRRYRHGLLVPRSVSRQTTRRAIARTARKRGVDPQLALAVAWQESGWQMDQISSARAIGAMQVLPSTVEWMELYVGRGLNPYRLRGNARTGVELLRVLGSSTSSTRHQVAAYYQGLGAVREHGLYQETRPYVRNVLAIKRRLERGQSLR